VFVKWQAALASEPTGGPRLGSVPATEATRKVFEVTGVSAGEPADKGGHQGR